MLKNTRGPEGLSSKGEQLLRFDIDTDPMELDVSRVPARLRELPPPRPQGGRAHPHEQGRKGVIVLKPDERLKVFIRFRDFTGKYLLHCHNLSHGDHAMMARWDVVA
jgi:FtsP/CotA-like multicopper oxidase with cupredoxin domain